MRGCEQRSAPASGFAAVYMRGVATGGDGQAITSQPSVGMYLDEQPITTIQGNLDIHLYDIERVEALAGPQGTLYGASSQAGTIRIITNKPDPSGFAAGYSSGGQLRRRRRSGYVAEGFVNLPMGDSAAVRLVGWSRTMQAGSTTCWQRARIPVEPGRPADDFIVDNAEFVEDNYNTVDIAARARRCASTWARTGRHDRPHVPEAGAGGLLGRRPQRLSSGRRQATRSRTSGTSTRTTSGTRPGSRSKGRSATSTSCTPATTSTARSERRPTTRTIRTSTTTCTPPATSRGLFVDNNGEPAPARASILQRRRTPRRATSCVLRRLRTSAYAVWSASSGRSRSTTSTSPSLVEGLADVMLPNQGANPQFADIVYLNSMDREDTDEAIFGSVSFDITEKLELTVGYALLQCRDNRERILRFRVGL